MLLMDFETSVKLTIYKTIADTGRMPNSHDVSTSLNCPVRDVESAFQQLFQKRLLVLDPASSSQIRMAPPFSGIPTSHKVHSGGLSYYANCAWDALGISAALHREADIDSSCPDCGESLQFRVRHGKPLPQDCAVHFAVPAAHWWKDIIYT
jgi:hypothetical protein